MIDLCDFYGKPRLAFATRFAELLRDSNLIDEIPPVSVLRCACDSVNARAPAPGAVIRRLDTYLQRFSEDGCIRSSVIKALDAAFTSSTPLGTASESLGHDVQKVFREVSRYIYLQRQGGFVFRRTLQNITDTASCPLWNAHWGVAFLDCARLRDSSDMVKAPANLGSRVPPCGVRYLRIGKGRVHACVPGEGRGDPPRYRLFGNVAKDATVIDALGAIASSRGELQLAPEIWPEQKRATLQRHVVLRSPSPECIREIARRVRERSVV